MTIDLADLLQTTVRQGGSDLHLLAGEPPRIRINGSLSVLSGDHDALDPDGLTRTLYSIMGTDAQSEFEYHDGADLAYQVDELARFRVNVFRHIGGIGAVFRVIPENKPSLAQLGLPDVVYNFARYPSGIVLVTGKTGSGKSTTLAALIHQINDTRRDHIIAIEDPIEFVHSRRKSLVSQRQVGKHVGTFANALRSALREDPDVIMVGELRDFETMALAVTAAEMGILVLGTLHTSGAVATVDRMVNTFPAAQQAQVRNMLSTSLRATVSQQLLSTADGNGRVAAVEILINNHAVGNIIREGKNEQIEEVMRSGALVGMVTMDGSIQRLLDAGQITAEEAWRGAREKTRFASAAGQEQ